MTPMCSSEGIVALENFHKDVVLPYIRVSSGHIRPKPAARFVRYHIKRRGVVWTLVFMS